MDVGDEAATLAAGRQAICNIPREILPTLSGLLSIILRFGAYFTFEDSQ